MSTNDEKKENTAEEKVNFTYPEGYQEAADSLTFLPEDKRAAFMPALELMIYSML